MGIISFSINVSTCKWVTHHLCMTYNLMDYQYGERKAISYVDEEQNL